MSLMSDKPLEPIQEIKPRSDEGVLDRPALGEAPEPLPAWAQSQPAVRHPRAKIGVWPKGMRITPERVAEFFPDGVKEMPPPPVDPYSGFDYAGRPAWEVWQTYLLNVGNRQTAIDAANAGMLMITSGTLAGRGRAPAVPCLACGTAGVTLLEGRCAGGCT